MDHVGCDLAARAFISNPQNSVKEACCRELISPVLVAAVVIAGAGNIEMYVFSLKFTYSPCKHMASS